MRTRSLLYLKPGFSSPPFERAQPDSASFIGAVGALRATSPTPLAARLRVTIEAPAVTNYTADYNNVKVYDAAAKDPNPIEVISADLGGPSGDCIDGDGTLYVATGLSLAACSRIRVARRCRSRGTGMSCAHLAARKRSLPLGYRQAAAKVLSRESQAFGETQQR